MQINKNTVFFFFYFHFQNDYFCPLKRYPYLIHSSCFLYNNQITLYWMTCHYVHKILKKGVIILKHNTIGDIYLFIKLHFCHNNKSVLCVWTILNYLKLYKTQYCMCHRHSTRIKVQLPECFRGLFPFDSECHMFSLKIDTMAQCVCFLSRQLQLTWRFLFSFCFSPPMILFPLEYKGATPRG